MSHKSIYKKKHLNKSLCREAHIEIARMIPRYILREFKTNISSGIDKFIHNHKTKLQHILDISYTIQNTPNFHIGYRHINLADDSDAAPFKIPSFIDVFRHLITLPTITTQLTSGQLSELSKILVLPTKHYIYDALHRSPVGIKLADAYTRVQHEIDLTQQFPTTDFHALLFNSFTSYTILELIESRMNHVSICTLTYNGKQYPNFLYIYHNCRPRISKLTKTSLLDNFEINQISEHILRRVVFLGELIESSELPNRLIIFLTDAKKEIDNSLEYKRHFRTLNVNTAVTNMHDIIIYRSEELYKSVFHELIHFHNLDCKPIELTHMILDYLINTHNISSTNEYLVYEAITESLANTLNVIYLSNGITEFNNNLSHEIMFSTFQVAKILHICKYNNWGEFTLLENEIKDTRKHWRQDSCVLSYYILKLYILLNLDAYWKHLLDARMKVQTSETHMSHLLNIFDHGRKHSSLKKVIDNLLLAKANKKTRINKSLRMTCLDNSDL